MTDACSCPEPFTEDSYLCHPCEQRWIDGLIAQDADRVPPDEVDNDLDAAFPENALTPR